MGSILIFRSKEQEEYYSRLAAHIANPDAPLLLEGATGLGKTLPYMLAALRSNRRVALVYPTHQLIDQALNSWDLKRALEDTKRSLNAFRPRHYFDGDEDAYLGNKTNAASADIMLCTSVSVIIDQRMQGDYNGATERDIIIFDEADQLPAFAALTADASISKQELSDYNVKGIKPDQTIKDLLARKNVSGELKARAKVISELLEEDVWFIKVGMTDDGGIAAYSRLPGRLLKKISNRPSTIFVSATLTIGGKFNDFKRAMGIVNESSFSKIIEPTKHGTLTFDFFTDHQVGTEEWLDTVVQEIESADQPVLVATPSHALAQQLGDRLVDATVRSPDETTTEAIQRIGNKGILIAAGAWAGLDVPLEWATIVVPRVPFTGPKALFDTWYEDEEEQAVNIGEPMAHYIDSRNSAARRMKQVFGRGLRHPDAVCRIVICDPRVAQLGDIAPERFGPGYFEGRSIEKSRTISERNPALRLDALRHYGTDCQACDFKPVSLRQVEVHHLNPLADRGPGYTKLVDVAVLCRNCHGLAHTEDPPIPLKRLSAMKKSRQSKKTIGS
tara:strand:- start:35 stop:1711 length:1677 start_codon:yes stop_codon:yes gene_type:complete